MQQSQFHQDEISQDILSPQSNMSKNNPTLHLREPKSLDSQKPYVDDNSSLQNIPFSPVANPLRKSTYFKEGENDKEVVPQEPIKEDVAQQEPEAHVVVELDFDSMVDVKM